MSTELDFDLNMLAEKIIEIRRRPSSIEDDIWLGRALKVCALQSELKERVDHGEEFREHLRNCNAERWKTEDGQKIAELTHKKLTLESELKKLKQKQETWQQTWDAAVATNQELQADFTRLREENEEAADIIQWLLDLQNGCPLPKYEKDFERENKRAEAFISRSSIP